MDKKIDKKEYELSYMVKKQGDEANIESVITQHDGEVFDKGAAAETRLAYPIKKHNIAFFGYFHFRALPEMVEKMSQALKHDSSVLRMLVVTPPLVRGARIERPRREMKSTDKTEVVSSIPSKGNTLTNKDLEDKLEEILN